MSGHRSQRWKVLSAALAMLVACASRGPSSPGKPSSAVPVVVDVAHSIAAGPALETTDPSKNRGLENVPSDSRVHNEVGRVAGMDPAVVAVLDPNRTLAPRWICDEGNARCRPTAQSLCQRGNGEACVWACVERIDGSIDLKRAKKMAADVRQRCLSGNFEACAFVGDLESLSKSGPRSSSQAIPPTTWYELGCPSG